VLNLKGVHVEGNGSGIGILIRHSADHTVLEGADEGAEPGSPGHFTGTVWAPATPQAKVYMWNIGVEDDADNAVIGLFDQIGGSSFQQGEGNNIGLLFNGVHGTVATAFNAQYNKVAGVVAQNSSALSMFNFSSSGANPHGNIQPIGVMFDSTNDSSIGPASMDHNHVYGLWLARSSRNSIIDSNGTMMNEDTGIHIGCGSLHCRGYETSDSNKVTESGAPQNGMNGILIEKHNYSNIITVTHNEGNPQGHDMVDENPHCGSDIWYNNAGTSNQSCIH
jgi:hypothetical protein